MWPFADLVTFTEEILNGNLHILCSVSIVSLLPLLFRARVVRQKNY